MTSRPRSGVGARPDGGASSALDHAEPSPRSKLARLCGQVLVALALGWVVLGLRADWTDLADGTLRLAWIPLGLHLAALLASFLFLVASWSTLLGIVGRRLPALPAAMTWFASALGRYVPGRIGAFATRIVACRRVGVDPRRATTALVVEQSLYGFVAVGVVGASATTGLLPDADPSLVVLAVTIFVLAPLGLGFALRSGPIAGRLRTALRRVAGVEAHPRWPLRSVLAVCLMLAGWSLYGVSGYFLVGSLTTVPSASALPVGLAFVAAWGAGYLAFVTPGGLGVREATLALLLTPHVPPPVPAVVAVLSRLTWVALELCCFAATAVLTRDLPAVPEASGPG